MTTKKQIAVNRRNAKKSTGPKTEAGKAKSSLNATKHGLTSRRVVLDDEDEEKYRDFRYPIFDDLEPAGNLETAFACRIAEKMWRLRRVPEIEADLLERLRDEAGGGDGIGDGNRNRGGVPWLGAAWAADGGPYGGALARLVRYESALERGVSRLTAELRKVQAQRVAREKRWAEEDAREAAKEAENARRYPGKSHMPPHAPPGAPPGASPVYSPDAAERGGEGTLYGDLPVDARYLNQPAEAEGDTGVQVSRRILRNDPISPPTDVDSGADWNRR